MIDTVQIFSGSTPIDFAKYVFMTAPNICCGDFALDNCGTRCGYWDLMKRIHPGQQEVNIGRSLSSPFWSRSKNSAPSSMIVKVSRECCVKYIVKTDLSKGINNLSDRCLFSFHAECFPPSCTNSRCDLYNSDFFLSASADQTFSVSSRSRSAPTGQWVMH